jgi:hypothetical protein
MGEAERQPWALVLRPFVSGRPLEVRWEQERLLEVRWEQELV